MNKGTKDNKAGRIEARFNFFYISGRAGDVHTAKNSGG
jgi:hypothetical protein